MHPMIYDKRNFPFCFVVAFITFIGFMIRLRVFGHIGPYPAEWYVVHIVSDYTVSDYLKKIYIHPELSYQPVFFLLSKISWFFSETLNSLRIFPLIFGVSCIPAAAWCTRKYLNRTSATVAAAFIASSVLQTEMSVAIRPYSIVMFLSLISAGLVRDICNEKPRRIALFGVNMLLLLTHLHPILWVVPLYIFLSFSDLLRSGVSLRRIFKYSPEIFISGALVLPRLIMLNAHFRHPDITLGTAASNFFEMVRFTASSPLNCISGSVFLFFIISGAVKWIFRIRNLPDSALLLWQAIILSAPVCLMIFSALVKPVYLLRYVIFTSIPAVLFFASNFHEKNKNAAVVMCALFLSASSMTACYRPAMGFVPQDLDPVIEYTLKTDRKIYLVCHVLYDQIIRRYYEGIYRRPIPNFRTVFFPHLTNRKLLDTNALFYPMASEYGDNNKMDAFKRSLHQKGYQMAPSGIRLSIGNAGEFYELKKSADEVND